MISDITVNGLLIRYLDYNDTYLSLEPAHPSDNLAAVFRLFGTSRAAALTAYLEAVDRRAL
jgi:2-methylcitrate dehydratase